MEKWEVTVHFFPRKEAARTPLVLTLENLTLKLPGDNKSVDEEGEVTGARLWWSLTAIFAVELLWLRRNLPLPLVVLSRKAYPTLNVKTSISKTQVLYNFSYAYTGGWGFPT